MTEVDHILGIIKDSKTEAESKERLKEFLARDYIPKNSAKFCPMPDDLIDVLPALAGMRCARITGCDPQSGNFYCGEPGFLYGWSKKYPDIYYIMCKACANASGVKL